MDAIECIKTRRSIRRYNNKPVDDETVDEILRCAMMAPSAMDQQPWRFIVIRDRNIMHRIPDIQPYSRMLLEAQLAIAVCADLTDLKAEAYWVQDCSAATQNLLLAAHALGLGAVWLGFYPREDRVKNLSQLLKLPENVVPLNVVSIGHPAEEKDSPDRFDKAKIHRNQWA